MIDLATPIRPALEVSFEIFPPAEGAADTAVMGCVDRLAPLAPRFVSVTYGAGGTTQERTLTLLRALRARHPGLQLAGHLTCADASREEVLAVAEAYRDAGVSRIVALRGDGSAHPQGFADAAALVGALSEIGFRDIAVAAYPETHPLAASPAADIDSLKRKLDAGANAAITQFFFENDDFYRFVDACRKAGIAAPIIPGMLPIGNFERAARFAARCGAKIPARMAARFAAADARGCAHELAAAYAAGQCDELRAQGVRRFHFYTLNRPELSLDVCRSLGVTAAAPHPLQAMAQ